ncbi:rhodanese-like domain-containing protein [Kitasatospora sp. NPDC098663]|uniref:rhodanese-like domain-containing protein n=1 Tax=Kitasatospora sp. NPDC098663 TaxID=3364096 RepID=UPI0038045E4D
MSAGARPRPGPAGQTGRGRRPGVGRYSCSPPGWPATGRLAVRTYGPASGPARGGSPASPRRGAARSAGPAGRGRVRRLGCLIRALGADHADRFAGECEVGASPGSLHLPLAELPARHGELPTDRRVVLHCAGGSRSSIAASLVRRHGHPHTYDLIGGYGAWHTLTHPA